MNELKHESTLRKEQNTNNYPNSWNSISFDEKITGDNSDNCDYDDDSYDELKLAMDNIKRKLFSPRTGKVIDDRNNPWAGLASYEDPETTKRKLLFCGRDDECYDVVKLIENNLFITLYGKSGIGKTSLLNAGVFPELRKSLFFPIRLRLGIRSKENPNSFQTIITEAIEGTVCKVETINVVDEQLNEQAVDYIWNYFARHRFYNKTEEILTPVIVFDQFEELFRANREKTEVLLRQLDYINDKDHILENCTINGRPYHYFYNYRFVISIREDNLYDLEDSIDNCYLPALKRCRYRLRSLSAQGAKDVILKPGKGLFDVKEQDEIVSIIVNYACNEDKLHIDTNILSIICHRLYIEHLKSSEKCIKKSSVIRFISGNPFEKLFQEATRSLSKKEKRYIVEHFIDSFGNRNSLSEQELSLNVKNYSSLIEGANRILQRIPLSSDNKNLRVELLHDSFCEPIRRIRDSYDRKNNYRSCGCLTVTFVFFMLYVLLLVYFMREKQKDSETIVNTTYKENDVEDVYISDQIVPEDKSKEKYLSELEMITLSAFSQKQYEEAEKFAYYAISLDKTKMINKIRLLEIFVLQNKYKEVSISLNRYGHEIIIPLIYDFNNLIESRVIDMDDEARYVNTLLSVNYSVIHNNHNSSYVKALCRLSFHAICLGRYKEAEQFAVLGINTDSTQLYNYARLIESITLQGRINEALLLCKKYQNELDYFILSDFEYLLKEDVVPKSQKSNVRKIMTFFRKRYNEIAEK